MLKEIEFQMSQNPSSSEADMNLVRQLLSDIKYDGSKFDYEKHIRLVLAWKTKSIKRHFISEKGKEIEDNISQRWSTGFYRIDLSLKTFKEKLQGKKY